MIVTKGATNVSVYLRIVDNTDGTPELSVVWNTSGIDLWYFREGAVHSSITEATTTEGAAHTDGGFIHISDGVYKLDVPDAAFLTGVDTVVIGGTVTGMVVFGPTISLLDADLYDAVRMGMTALPNAAAEAAGGLYTRGTGAGQINQDANGRADVNAVAWNELATVTLPAVAGDAMDLVANAVDTTSVATGAIDADALGADAITSAKIADNAIAAEHIATDAINAAALAADALAEIKTQATTAISDVRLDELLSADSDIDGVAPPTVGSVFHELMTKTAGSFTYDQTTDSLEAIKDQGDSAWLTATGFSTLVATDIVSDGTAINTTAGVVDTVTTATTATTATNVTTVNGFAAGAIDAAAIANGAIDAATFAAGAITSTVIADAAITAPKITAMDGTAWGNAQNFFDSTGWAGGTLMLTTHVSAIGVDVIWDEDQASHVIGNSMGAIATELADLTTTVGAAGAGLTDITLANDLSATMKTSVQTAVDAALDTAIAELGVATPSATPGLKDAVMLLYMALRNKTVVQTSGTDALEIHNNAGTKIASKLLTDDGSDYTEAEMT